MPPHALAALYRAIGACVTSFPDDPIVLAKLVIEEGAAAEEEAILPVVREVDPIGPLASREQHKIVSECIQRLRQSGDGGELDLDKQRDPSVTITPIPSDQWTGADGTPEWIVPHNNVNPRHRLLFLHGGGYTSYSPSDVYRPFTTRLAAATGMAVLAIDYRLAPAHPFPAALEDALAAHRWLWHNGPPARSASASATECSQPAPLSTAYFTPDDAAEAVFVCGDSAGGGLALALAGNLAMSRAGHPQALFPSLCCGVPQPTALALVSPWTDLTASLPSYSTRAWSPASAKGDPIFSDGAEPAKEIADAVEYGGAYLGVASSDAGVGRSHNALRSRLAHPLVSPVFLPPAALAELPPTLLLVGDSEVMLGDSTEVAARMVEATGRTDRVRLRVFRRMWHVFPLYSEACGQAEACAAPASSKAGGACSRKTRTKAAASSTAATDATAATTSGAVHTRPPLLPAGMAERAADDAKLLYAACVALDDIRLWISQHTPTTPTASTAAVRARMGPALLCVLPVVVVEVATVCRQRMDPVVPSVPADANAGAATEAASIASMVWALAWASAIIANSMLRICLPSSYCPRSQALPGLLPSPLMARVLATLAEYAFYRAEALALGMPFWSADEPMPSVLGSLTGLSVLGSLTGLGEVLCWCHLLLQSELLGCLEDGVWTLYQATVLLRSSRALKWVVALPYCLNAPHHLYRQLSRVERPLLGAAVYWRAPVGLGIAPDEGVKAWATPSLLAKPVTYALLRLAANPGVLGSVRALWFGALPLLLLLLGGALRWSHEGRPRDALLSRVRSE